MRLSRLKLAGFKTFVDPTTVLCPGDLVGIVGPNGCGKSNVIDAVRWVLGETRASALRGASMQDVIFNGSTTRKPVSRASVELVFDNAEGKAAGQWRQYAEVSVKRVLDRTGNSSYYINNVLVRRKDVVDLFLGTGLGPRAYAIIEQGMISRIIEARPEEVRGFLEEAAGVTKYRERRKETEGRLSDARENLLRLDDITMELGDRIARLEKQARVAERYRSLHDEHEQKQQLLWLSKRNVAREQKRQAAEALNEATRQLEMDSARLQSLAESIEAARDAHLKASDDVHVSQNDLYAAAAEVSRLEAESRHLVENQQRLTSRIEQLDAEMAHWLAREVELNTERSRWHDLQEAAELRLAQAQARQEAASDQVPDAEAQFRAADATAAAARRELAQTEQQARVEEARCASARRALDALTQRRERLTREGGNIVAPEADKLAELEMAVAAQEEALNGLADQLAEAQAAVPALQERLKAAISVERDAQRELTELRARRQALVQLQHKVQQQGELGKWLESQGLASLKPMWASISVADGWSAALESALRERLAALTGVDDDAVLRALDAPPPASVVLAWPVTTDEAPSSFDGLSRMVDQVSVAAPWQGTVNAWLKHAYVVEDLAPWLDQRERLPAQVRLYNRLGQCLTRECFAHVSGDARTQGVMERAAEIEALETQIAALDERFDTAHGQVEGLEALLGERQSALTDIRREHQARQSALHDHQLALLKLTQAQERALEQQARISGDLEELLKNEATEKDHLAEAGAELDRCEALIEALRERAEHATQVRGEREAALREAQSQVQTLSREAQEATFSVRECQGKLDDIARNLSMATDQTARLRVEQEARRAELSAVDPEAGQSALHEALELRGAREAALAARRDALAEATANLKAIEEQRLRVEQGAAPLRDRVGELRLAVQAAELAESQQQERLDEAQADEDTLTPLLDGVSESTLQHDVTRLGRAIASLGAVNLAALDELKEAEERKGYLDAQHQDLTEAIGTLEDAIRRIDRETREQLQATYDTVSRQFSTLFPQLFGGGQAKLELTGEEILDAGIQIVAQPPGKKNASIHLLSGGEKALTAIALVFSLFQLNPAPFCMLDEVDAPLDDTNTGRFCEMVKRMSSQTQFLFISHNKITMEIARQLVGVTMQEQGVSRVVEVDMEEALRMADNAPA